MPLDAEIFFQVNQFTYFSNVPITYLVMVSSMPGKRGKKIIINGLYGGGKFHLLDFLDFGLIINYA